MISIMGQSGHVSQGIKEYILDTPDDVENLPVDGIHPGSYAFVISNSSVYMLNNNGEWIEV